MKATQANPFYPQFGKRPDHFIGRDYLIRDFLDSLEEPNDPHRVTVISGIRGSGKTALLSGVREALPKKRFAVADVTAGASLLQSILDQLQLESGGKKRSLSGVDLGAFGFSMGVSTSRESEQHGFRYYLTLLIGALSKEGRGTVFIIDELHNDESEMREFVTTYQHLVREGANVALLMAGLPQAVNSVLNDKVLTFLHRSHRIFLNNVDLLLVENLYESVFKEGNRPADAAVPLLAAQASQGFPYLIQLIGYYLWKSEVDTITPDSVAQALVNSKAELFQNVHALMVRELSAVDREFLMAMADNEDDSVAMAKVISSLGVTSGYASRYRQRLLEAGVIDATAHGYVAFAPPYLKEYLRRKQAGGIPLSG
jgi:nucleoside-triphosphatase THEP1